MYRISVLNVETRAVTVRMISARTVRDALRFALAGMPYGSIAKIGPHTMTKGA